MKKNKQIIGRFILWGCLCIFLYAILNSFVADILLKKRGSCHTAIINKDVYGNRTGPSLGYKFFLDGKIYYGAMFENGILKIGDSVCIVYLPLFPSINRPITYFDNGEIKCSCNQ